MKKKLFILALALSGATLSKAQTQKGNQLIGGNIELSISKNEIFSPTKIAPNYSLSYTSKVTSFGIGPSYSYFIADRLELGISAGYSTSKTTNTLPPAGPYQNVETKTQGYAVSAQLRKYALFAEKIGIRTGPFAQYQYQKQTNEFTTSTNNYDQQYKSFSAGLGLDLVYFPTRKIGLASTLGRISYSHTDLKSNNDTQKNNSFDLNFISTGLTLSAYYCF